jgi:dTDP-4-amino-4,6-dideoxygalactose transaminase
MYEMGQQEFNAIRRVFERRQLFRYGGPETAKFESEWSELMGVGRTVAVTSGTAALIAALKAMAVGPGQSVLVPGYTFISTALAVTAVGAIPLYVEDHTTCVIPVHMQGMPCNMDRILDTSRRHKLLVLEDACQAVGGSYHGRRLGSLGHMGAYSFNQYKIITCGEGGACVTSDPMYAERAFMAQDGSCSVWDETGPMSPAFYCGGNYRFNEVSAAAIRVQARRLDTILRRLREARAELLARIQLPQGFRFVPSNDEEGNCGVCFLIQAPDAETAERAEAAIAPHVGLHRPINSGRHVYSAWDVINSRVGGHHPDWDCFQHPKNQHIETNYERAMPHTDDFLERTLLCATPYRTTPSQLKACAEGISTALARL